jgi:TolB-like protein
MNKLHRTSLFLTGILLFACAGNLCAQQAMSLDGVIIQAAKDVETRLSSGSKLAVLNFTSTAEIFSDYVIEELTGALVMNRKVTVIERKSLDLIRKEMNLQLSGDVSDDSAQAIGKQLGAQAIVTGSLTNLGDVYRFRVKVINVETARIEAQFSYNLGNNQQVAFLLNGNQQNSPPVVPVQGQNPPSAASVQGQTAPKPPQTTDAYNSGDAGPAGGTIFYPVVRTSNLPPTPARNYRVGDTGPAGGIIFYVNPNANDGWKYLEAAPATTERTVKWGNVAVKGTGLGVGEGKKNTELIVMALNDQGENGAAFFCDDFEMNGFDDWFLPSRGELNLMYTRLKERGLGGFKSDWYWSSSENTGNSYYALFQNFSDGRQSDSGKGDTRLVRAVRQF